MIVGLDSVRGGMRLMAGVKLEKDQLSPAVQLPWGSHYTYFRQRETNLLRQERKC